uniref:F-box domain-containing protein n=1 Tax=Macrostomum lignano TaxID=282301 RepID=A0A1I8HGM3_9PLAT
MSASSASGSAAAASAGGTGAASSSASSASTRRKRGRRSGHGQQQLQLQRASKRPRLQDEELSRGSGGYCSEDVGALADADDAVNSSGGSLDDLAAKAELFLGSGAGPSSGSSGACGVTTRARIRESAALAMAEALRLRPKSFDHLPPEVYCRILQYLSVVELLRVTAVNRQFRAAVTKHLRLTKRINFCSGLPFTFLSEQLDDATLSSVLALCPEVTHILGFYPRRILHRAQVGGRRALTYAGILQALKQCKKLKSIEIMDVDLMSRIFATFPRVKFHGMFRNRPDVWDCERAYEGPSPLPGSASKLLLNPHINSLTKVDLQCVCLNALPKMDCVRYLYLKWVRFSGNDPFGNFSAPKLQTFVMNNCAGPSNAFRYLRVFTAVARAQQLARLELVGLRFIGGLVEHIVDEMNGESRSFRTMQKLVLAGNKAITEIDAGYFLLASSACLGCVCLQSSLCKDSLFVALCHSQPVFPKLDTLVLGYRDPCPDVDRSPFSVEPSEYPCLMTDYGMAYVGRCFRRLASLTVSRAPFLTDPMRWLDQPMPLFEALRCLTLEKCPCINPNRLGALIIQLPNLEMLVLRDMFDPAPRGCGFLGLAAGQQWGIFPQSAPTHDSVQGFFPAPPHPADDPRPARPASPPPPPPSFGAAGDGQISDDQPEPKFQPDQRDFWMARDVCLDTHDLRMLEPEEPVCLTLRSATLHAVHLERCGLTSLVCAAPRLRTLTSEACPRLRDFHLHASRCLRRVRVVACAAFNYHRFYRQLAELMASRRVDQRESGAGDDSLSVCFRPLGEYDPLAERLLLQLPGAHLLLTHDFKGRDAVDRDLDRLQSHFQQIFRDIMHFADNLIRRDYVKETQPSDSPSNRFGHGQLLRFESGHSAEGHPYDLLTDIPWIGECGVNPFPSLTDDADQLYQSLVETHALACYKMASRGLFLHVQCRDLRAAQPAAASAT